MRISGRFITLLAAVSGWVVLVMVGVVPAQENRTYLLDQLAASAIERTHHSVSYDGSYRQIDYPGGDVPENTGVCTDVGVRSYRRIGIDLQRRIHEDMVAHFDSYSKIWGLARPDPNIDHRRVPNLQTFFQRQGAQQPISSTGDDYHPGDVVTWRLPGNFAHIGLVVNIRSADGRRPLIVNNIGAGPHMEDALFSYAITGHYRYAGG